MILPSGDRVAQDEQGWSMPRAVLRQGITAVAAMATLLLPASQVSADVVPLVAPMKFGTAFAASLAHPTASPPGANDSRCKPSAAHPRPVVLVHGTAENAYDNWAGLSPVLKKDGYCVFAANIGGVPGSAFQALGPVARSAESLAGFVDQVLRVTGARKVDIVGHSQGGMMPRYYIKHLAGASKVDKLIALAPSNHGTTGLGILDLIGRLPGGRQVVDVSCPACADQMAGSPFLSELNADFETVPGVAYTVIVTRMDEVVTPYRSGFLSASPGTSVVNATVQDFCPLDITGHLGISYDVTAHRMVRNALDPGRAVRPTCLG
ncbi:alpha/beta fold hydrolase [Streptomyces sp. NPDC094032]|uniref:esterase/lipase family protein n=1 Tax=Streptomyces sp. NPDC094032 TaxID=3155308 RepID=UPI00331C3253